MVKNQDIHHFIEKQGTAACVQQKEQDATKINVFLAPKVPCPLMPLCIAVYIDFSNAYFICNILLSIYYRLNTFNITSKRIT